MLSSYDMPSLLYTSAITSEAVKTARGLRWFLIVSFVTEHGEFSVSISRASA